MSCGVGGRCGLDHAMLWLWCGLAATALIWPLAWELPYAGGVAPKRQKEKKIVQFLYISYTSKKLLEQTILIIHFTLSVSDKKRERQKQQFSLESENFF